MKHILIFTSLLLAPLAALPAADTTNSLESATRRGLARVKQAASDWQKHKTCFFVPPSDVADARGGGGGAGRLTIGQGVAEIAGRHHADIFGYIGTHDSHRS